MEITRGKLKGTKVTLHQFANDWLSVDTEDGNAMIINPTSVRLEPGEIEKFREHSSTGQFWAWYGYDPVGMRFVKQRRV